MQPAENPSAASQGRAIKKPKINSLVQGILYLRQPINHERLKGSHRGCTFPVEEIP